MPLQAQLDLVLAHLRASYFLALRSKANAQCSMPWHFVRFSVLLLIIFFLVKQANNEKQQAVNFDRLFAIFTN